MKTSRHLIWTLAALALVVSGCTIRRSAARVEYGASATVTVAAPAEVVVSQPPPPLRAAVEVVPAKPGPDAVWVEGYYQWSGRWVWTPGHWERNRAGYVWVAPVAQRRGGRIVYYGGYWRRESAQPAPVYRRPSVVAVARPPRAVGRVTVTPGRGQRGRGSVTVTAPRGRVEAQPPRGRGSVTVTTPRGQGRTEAPRGRGSVTVTTPRGQGRTEAPRGRGSVRVTTPRGHGQVEAQPPRGRGQVEARPPRGRGSVRVTTPREREPNRARRGHNHGERNRAEVEARPRTRVEVRPQATTRAPTAPAPVRRPDQGRTTTRRVEVDVNRPQPGVRTPVRPRVRNQPLSCRLQINRAPMGGIVTILGSGFTSSARVVIGGRGAEIVSVRPDRLQARVPQSPSGGPVRITQGGQTVSCGRLSVSSL